MEDRRLFGTILNQTITTKPSHRINNSQDRTRRMSGIMEQLNTSMGLRFSLNWKRKPADQQEELATRELIDLLRKDPAVMGDADRNKITNHFRAKIAKARELSHQSAVPATYSELMRRALDFRNWFEFQLYYQKGNSANPVPTKRELTNFAFNSFSGGEKAIAMYVPLFAALSAQYAAANEDSPQLMAPDGAFAGVDEIKHRKHVRSGSSAGAELYHKLAGAVGLLCVGPQSEHCRALATAGCGRGHGGTLSLGWPYTPDGGAMKNETLCRYFTDSPAWKRQLQQLRKNPLRDIPTV